MSNTHTENPTGSLETPSQKRLAQCLRRRREEIVADWIRLVRIDPELASADGLSEPSLKDHIPTFLSELSHILADCGEHPINWTERKVEEQPSLFAHAASRASAKYEAVDALREFSLLRNAIIRHCFDTLAADPAAAQLIHSAIDRAIILVTNHLVELRRTEHRQLELEQVRYGLILENVEDYAIFTIDMNGEVVDWNTGAERITQFKPEEAIGRSCALIFTEDDRKARAPESEIETALREGRAADIRWHVRKDGSLFWGNGSLSALRDDSNRVIGFVKIVRDETAKKLAEEERARTQRELQEKNEELARASAVKDLFIATISHELRNPLGVLAGYISLLKEDGEDFFNEAIEAMERSVSLMTQHVDDLLDISRIVAGKLSIEPRSVEVAPAIACALESVQALADERRLELRSEIEPSLPLLCADPNRLQQIFWNLLANAIKFSKQESSVVITARRVSRGVAIGVTDFGRGIAPDFLPYVFDRFRQENAEHAKRNFGGLGLGLAIVKNLVELQGGSVQADSAGIGKGATFTVTLPTASS